MTARHRPALRLIPFAGVVLVILAGGLSSEPVPELFRHQDKLHHFTGFAALAFSARLAFPRMRSTWLIAGILATALLIEFGQGLLPRRMPSIADMFANALGVMLGWLTYGWLSRWK